MKKNNFWFTFIELVVVIWILAITSNFVISSFFKNFDKQSLLSEANLINIKIWDLDNEIWKNITDYELFLHTWSFYYYTTNTFYKDILNQVSFVGFTWTFTTNYSEAWDLWSNNLKIFFRNKILEEQNISMTWSFEKDFSKIWNYYLKFENENINLNDFFIEYFSQINENNQIILTSIIDEDNNTYTWIIVKNWLWLSREIFDYFWNKIDKKINLTFENKDTQINLELIK